jgi:hypothetical protein
MYNYGRFVMLYPVKTLTVATFTALICYITMPMLYVVVTTMKQTTIIFTRAQGARLPLVQLYCRVEYPIRIKSY